MEFDIQFWIQILIYGVSFGTMYGSFKARLEYLEKKMDKHNNLQDRVAVLENSDRTAHHRIDELREEIREIDRHEN